MSGQIAGMVNKKQTASEIIEEKNQTIEDKNKGKKPLCKKKNYNWLMKECEDFKKSPYFVELTKDQCYRIQIFTTNAVYRGKHHNEF